MMIMRTLNQPSDIDNYPNNRIVYRSVLLPAGHPQAPLSSGGRVVECQWGDVYTADEPPVLIYSAQIISFAQNSDGGWDKSTSLRLS